jgi:hypothetical protein
MRELQPLATLRASTSCTGIILPLLYFKGLKQTDDSGIIGSIFPVTFVTTYQINILHVASRNISQRWKEPNYTRTSDSLCHWAWSWHRQKLSLTHIVKGGVSCWGPRNAQIVHIKAVCSGASDEALSFLLNQHKASLTFTAELTQFWSLWN